MSTGPWVVVAAVAVALGLGLYRLGIEGRFRGTRASLEQEGAPVPSGSGLRGVNRQVWADIAGAVPAAELGERATLLQFSTAFCAPCRATRRTLSDVAGQVPGVSHVEIDAEHHLDLVRTLGILRTPTTLVLDSLGREVTRATGAPRREQVYAALGWA